MIDQANLTDSEKLMLDRRLKDFKKSGVDKSVEIRERVKTLNLEITEIGNSFDQAIREDTRFVETTIEKLAGLPGDYIAAKKADENGIIRISTDYPDYFPVMQYAHDDNLRKKLYIASKSIGSPSNSQNLLNLIKKRHELANLLGYENYAALAMDGLMIKSPDRANVFLNLSLIHISEPTRP